MLKCPYLRDLPAFMVAAYQCDAVWVADLATATPAAAAVPDFQQSSHLSNPTDGVKTPASPQDTAARLGMLLDFAKST
jgi:hypothetical protein